MKRLWKVAIVLFIVLILGVGGFLVLDFLTKDDTREVVSTKTIVKVASNLDGLSKEADTTNGRIFAVSIDNHSFAQSHHRGISQATLFYETMAEGGITRILAFFDGAVSIPVGPVRSIRDYYLDFAEEYESVLMHVGGSSSAMRHLYSSERVFDMDGFVYEGIEDYYQRDRSIQKPHNMFVNLENVDRFASEHDWKGGLETPRFEFKKGVFEEGEPAKSLELDYSFPQYRVRFEYDSELGYYSRFLGGKEHVDTLTGTPLFADNIIVQFTDYWPIDEAGRLEMITKGVGKAMLIRDGRVLQGIWEKDHEDLHTSFVDEEGGNFILKPGVTWIEVINEEWRVDVEAL